MSARAIASALVLGILGLIVLANSLYVIDMTEQVVITQFGKPIGDPIREPGLRLKAPFVCRMLTGRSRPVLWVDCDSEMLSAPTVLEDLQCDFAACDRSEFFGKPARRKWIVGALLFNPTPAARRLAGLWESLCNSDDRHGSDEYYFDVAWRQLRQQVISESLPPHFLALRTARQRGSTPRPGTVVLTTLSGNAARWNRRRRRRERSYPTRQESTEQTVA